MKFVVYRTSIWSTDWDTVQPCPGAIHEGENKWTIEIADLDALVAFCHEHGKLVLEFQQRRREDGEWVVDEEQLTEIEIYDYYRE